LGVAYCCGKGLRVDSRNPCVGKFSTGHDLNKNRKRVGW